MIGDVHTSFVRNSTVHHAFNRAIAVHGVNNLTLANNVAYDTRGHALFIEDGTELNTRLENNLVVLVRPVLSLLLVDQSPACYWIVHPHTHMIGNVAGGSSHYGYWLRMLPKPDGVSGQAVIDDDVPSPGPMYSPLAVVRDNVAHSVGKFGVKLNSFFPSNACMDWPEPAVIYGLVVYKAGAFGLWGENIVGLDFEGTKMADYGMAGMELMSVNGKLADFVMSEIRDSLFVGNTRGNVTLRGRKGGKFLSETDIRPSPPGAVNRP